LRSRGDIKSLLSDTFITRKPDSPIIREDKANLYVSIKFYFKTRE
jgi:hypothetical protein